MKCFVYADNAATTRLDKDAFEAMKPYLLYEYGNASQSYSFSRKPQKALQVARMIIAECINAHPEEIYFTSGGTESNNWAIKEVAFVAGKDKTVVTSSFEHYSVLRSCEAIEKLDYPVSYISPNRNGFVEEKEPEAMISTSTGLVSVMLANNEIGTIRPIQKLVATAHKYNVLFHTDAVQCVGHIPVDVKK